MKDFFVFDPKLLFYGFATIFFASFGQTFFISIHNTEIRSFYNLTDGEFGFIYSLGTLLSSILLISFAKLIDYVDLRLYSLGISLGLALSCLGFFVSYNSIFFLFLILFGLRFFGQGAMAHAGETTMARYFGSNRGKALSVCTFGGMIGVMLLPIIVVKLSDLLGWRSVWAISSISIFIIFIPLLFLSLRNQKLRHSNFSNANKNSLNNHKLRTRDIAKDRKFYVYLPISIALPFISTGLTFHQIFIINQKGWTLAVLANGFIFLGIFSIIGLMFAGPIVDKFNTQKVILFSLFPLFLAVLTIALFDNYMALFVYMSFLGIGWGISTPFIGSLWAELYTLESLGTVKALLRACSVFATALSPVIFGYMIDFNYGILSLCIMSLLIISASTLLPILYQKFND